MKIEEGVNEVPAPIERSGNRPPAVLDAAALFGAANEIRLLHRGEEYRLRITRSGKLILTK